jgi:hypothetical protein
VSGRGLLLLLFGFYNLDNFGAGMADYERG